MKRASLILKVVWQHFRDRWPALVAFATACGVFGCLMAATSKPKVMPEGFGVTAATSPPPLPTTPPVPIPTALPTWVTPSSGTIKTLPSTAANPAADVWNDNLVCGEKKWVIVGPLWGSPKSIPPEPGDSAEGPMFYRTGTLYSNLQAVFFDEGPPTREHVVVFRSIRLPDVRKLYRYEAIEREIEQVK